MKTRKGRPRPDPGCSATDDDDDDDDDDEVPSTPYIQRVMEGCSLVNLYLTPFVCNFFCLLHI
jgi:hypothetical protein